MDHYFNVTLNFVWRTADTLNYKEAKKHFQKIIELIKPWEVLALLSLITYGSSSSYSHKFT